MKLRSLGVVRMSNKERKIMSIWIPTFLVSLSFVVLLLFPLSIELSANNVSGSAMLSLAIGWNLAFVFWSMLNTLRDWMESKQ